DPQCSYISKILNKRLAENGGVDVTGRVFDPMMLKIMLEQLCMESKIKMLFHSFICDVVVENEKIKYVVIANKSGTMAVEGKMFIDCTGDGDVSVLAGAKFTKGNPDDGKNQPISLRYIVDGVDVPELGRFFIDEIKRTGVSSACSYDNGNIYGACCRLGDWTLGDLFDKAIAAGDLIPQDKWYWQMFRVTGRPSAIAFNNPEFFEDVDGTNVEHLTRTQLEGKQTILRQMKFYKKYFKGFENAFIAEIAPMVGIRESRNITTEYVLSAEDLLSRKKFDDAFCQSNYPVDIHGKTLNFAKEIVAVDDGRP
ncbi:MAG: FAD-dependent oxidoreductase, partial [Clostridia bacterium]